MNTKPFYVKATYVLLFLFLFFLGLSYARTVLIPVTVAALLSVLLYPVANSLERWGIHRLLSSVLSIVVVLALLGGLIYFFSWQIIGFVNDIPQLTGELKTKLSVIQAYIEQQTQLSPTRQIEWLDHNISTALESSGYFVRSTLFATTHAFTMIAPVPFYIFFLLFYRDKFKNFAYRVSSEDQHIMVGQVIRRVKYVLQSYLSGVMIVVVIVAFLTSSGLLVMDIPYALLIGLLVALLNVIPYLGILIGGLCAMTITFITKDNMLYTVFVAALLTGIHLLEANIITPNIVGSKVSINPLAVLLALIIGEQVWGVMGMVLFVPLLGVLKVLFDSIEAMKPYGYLLGTEGMEAYHISWAKTKDWFRGKNKRRE